VRAVDEAEVILEIEKAASARTPCNDILGRMSCPMVDSVPAEAPAQIAGRIAAARLFAVTVVAALTLSACARATPYQPLGYGGGYSHVQYDANTYKVSFRGNGLTSRSRVEAHLMYRLAELTAETGHDYFIIVESGTHARQTGVTTDGYFTATTMGSTTHGTITPGQTITFTKHEASAVIKVFKGQKPSTNPAAYAAAEVLRHLGPSIER
jgi:hypothetical protein